MQCSASSSSASKQPTPERRATRPDIIFVWMVRLVVGALFIVSGVAKAIDPWGVLYKIEEYALAWGLDVPRAALLLGAIALSVWEGLAGFMLLLGCYRRSIVWLLLATMAFMLPLTVYIYVAHPVADCGCFGDFIVISHLSTLLKNVAITALLIPMTWLNSRVNSLVLHRLQWVAGLACTLYLLSLIMMGYNVQPIIDFRPWPEGTDLAHEAAGSPEADFEFVYERDGEQRVFGVDNLPDSSWTFVERRAVHASADTPDTPDAFTLYSVADGADATDEGILDDGPQLLVLIPDLRRADISFTYYLNAVAPMLERRGGNVTAVVSGADKHEIERWADLAAASYPIYTADPLQIKTLARGNVALVYLENGRIVWKRNAWAVDGEQMLAAAARSAGLSAMHIDLGMRFAGLSWSLAALLLVLVSWRMIYKFIIKKIHKS